MFVLARGHLRFVAIHDIITQRTQINIIFLSIRIPPSLTSDYIMVILHSY